MRPYILSVLERVLHFVALCEIQLVVFTVIFLGPQSSGRRIERAVVLFVLVKPTLRRQIIPIFGSVRSFIMLAIARLSVGAESQR